MASEPPDIPPRSVARSEVIEVMKRHLCILRDVPGAACACPGHCGQLAEEIMLDFEASGFNFSNVRQRGK